MKKRIVASILSGALLTGLSSVASGALIDEIINIDAKVEGNLIPFELEAGTYDVTVIGIADGGLYDAWNRWGVTTVPEDPGWSHYSTGNKGWVNVYSYDISGSTFTYGDGIRYFDPGQALANAIDSQFMLTAVTTVNFFIRDDPGWYHDNLGGISLRLTSVETTPVLVDESPIPPIAPNPVPEPATMFLFGTGLVGLAAASRRKKK